MYTGRADEETSDGATTERRTDALSILVVDEERLFCEILSDSFGRQGHLATCCSDGTEALEKARNGVFDVVMLDLNMPEMVGCEALEILRCALLESPLTMVTRADRSTLVRAPAVPAFGRTLGRPPPYVFVPVSISQTAEVPGGIPADGRRQRSGGRT
jgi:CheY-like chemotaxis protein